MSQRSVVRSTALAAALTLALPAVAHATFPGQNGKLSYALVKYDKSRKDYGSFGLGALFTLDPLTTGASPVALPFDPDANAYEPAWSPDGSKIAYGSRTDGRRDGLYVRDAATTAPPRLIAKTTDADTPTWTPDGSTVIYTDWALGIMAVPADGSADPRVLIRHPKRWIAISPSVTPDGKTIIFARQKITESAKDFRTEIAAADISGANVRKVLTGGASYTLPTLPDVSPDGTTIAFDAVNRKGVDSLFLAGIDGSKPRQLVSSPHSGFISAPAWSPDGKKVAASLYGSSIKKGGGIALVDVATRTLTTLRQQKKAFLTNVNWQPVSAPAPGSTPAG